MKKLIVHGTYNKKNNEPIAGDFLDCEIIADININKVRAASTAIEIDKIKTDDVLELSLDNGEIWLGNMDDLEELFPGQVARDGEDNLLLPGSFQLGNTNRGMADWVVKGVRLFRPKIEDKVVQDFIEKQERKFIPNPGLFRCPLPLHRELSPIKGASELPVEENKPYLLLIHGTASSTEGSFSGFANGDNGQASAAWETLVEIYGERMLTFEHYTLTKSPLENILDLLKKLPKGIRLHIVSHSRGGLLGELLSRSNVVGSEVAFTPSDFKVFEKEKNKRNKDIEAMQKLNTLFHKKQIKVEKFVRVACPTAGTTLASKRIDLYFNIMLNLIGQIPFLQGNPIFSYIKSLVIAIVKMKGDPNKLPGLEAMMPSSPFVRMLNNPTIEVESDLLAIAGNAQSDTFMKGVLKFLSKLYYWDKNDFVVNTPSMYRGARRMQNAYYFLDEKTSVSHFEYFRNQRTQQLVCKGLSAELSREENVRKLDWDLSEKFYLPITTDRSGISKPVVVVVPGVMGSELRVHYSKTHQRKVWLNFLNIGTGGVADLHHNTTNVEAVGLVAGAYKKICEYLEQSHHVVAFPYDWRKSILDAAAALKEVLEEQLKNAKEKPIRILAHSTGGLVVQAFIVNYPKVWAEIKSRGAGRVVMLGTPCEGSWDMLRFLLGKHGAIQKLSLVDLYNEPEDILEVLTQYQGLLQLLPQDASEDILGEKFWHKLEKETGTLLAKPRKEALKKASTFLKKMQENPIEDEWIHYIAGKASATPKTYKLIEKSKRDGAGKGICFWATSAGDGRTTWESGIPKNLPPENIWYMNTAHGAMANYEPAFAALVQLLELGKTTDPGISPHPPITRDLIRDFIMLDDSPAQIPDYKELEAALLGYELLAEEESPQDKVRVLMSHGDLSKAKYPVAVGHFKGDGIVSAEAALDIFMKFKLRARHNLGIYPGDIGTNEIILAPGNKPPGAIVIGLGTFDELSPGSLTRCIKDAALELAMQKMESAKEMNGREKDNFPQISTLLIGSGYGNLQLRLAIRSILLGIKQANDQIEEMGDVIKGMQKIRDLEFIEIYETQALNALRILRELVGKDGGFEDFVMEEKTLNRNRGGRKRVLLEDGADWWNRIKIACEKSTRNGGVGNSKRAVNLKFTSLTDRARAEENTISTQKSLLDKFIAQAVVSEGWNEGLAKTLFELMLPNDFKVYATDNRNILWILDEDSAAYPWELLQDTENGDRIPIAVRAGMIRQLVTMDIRRNVKASLQKTALVVGDPENNKTMPELKGAQEEALLVSTMLKNARFKMAEPLIRERSMDILQALFEKPYRLVHLAGHGIYEEEEDGTVHAGMVLDDDTLITPAIIRQMTNIPDLVFLNCCHLGKVEGAKHADLYANRHKLAANLGTQLIREGVKAVVVAGWAINDGAAKTFAEVFYREMLAGNDFGHAVHMARQQTFKRYNNNNTWGAYQCYGDPFFKLVRTNRGAVSPISPYSDRLEIIVALENIVVRSETLNSRLLNKLLKELKIVVSNTSRKLKQNAMVVEAIANAYAALGKLPEAIEYYDHLNTLEKATYSFKALEQAENLRARHAVKLFRNETKTEIKSEVIEEMVDKAIKQLNVYLSIRKTSERFNLLGSAYKKQAWVVGNKKDKKGKPLRQTALENAARNYEEANTLYSEKNNGKFFYYSVLNWMDITRLLQLLYKQKPTNDGLGKFTVEELLEKCGLGNLEQLHESSDFWTLVRGGDALLSKAMWNWEKEGEGNKEEIIDFYEKAWRVSGNFSEMDSVKSEFYFLQDLLRPISKRTKLVGLWNLVQLLLSDLETRIEDA